jgi:hypothetical protein
MTDFEFVPVELEIAPPLVAHVHNPTKPQLNLKSLKPIDALQFK